MNNGEEKKKTDGSVWRIKWLLATMGLTGMSSIEAESANQYLWTESKVVQFCCPKPYRICECRFFLHTAQLQIAGYREATVVHKPLCWNGKCYNEQWALHVAINDLSQCGIISLHFMKIIYMLSIFLQSQICVIKWLLMILLNKNFVVFLKHHVCNPSMDRFFFALVYISWKS